MKGQWIGEFSGDVAGKIMVNIDEVNNHYEGVAYVIPSDNSMPSSVGYFFTKTKSNRQKVVVNIYPIDPRTGYQCGWDDIKNLFSENIVHSEYADVSINFRLGVLHLKALSDLGVNLTASLKKPSDDKTSKVNAKVMTWDKYKNYISSLLGKGYLFRGQEKPWRLQTSFHRKGLCRISEFTDKHVSQLHQRLSALTKHYFNLSDPQQNGAFFNLLQHHGYPTPLLDWSYSPYVSAFFAFRNECPESNTENVRIYIFNCELWKKTFRQINNLNPNFPHLSVIEFIALENPRLIPQQAVTTATNLVDIEAYLLEKENESGLRFIEAVEIPAKYRLQAIKELAFMGITAGSMFPGIDGVCEELRQKNFGVK